MNSREPHAGLYVHIPFCRTKCPYCDFYSVTTPDLIPVWLEALRCEAIHYRDRFGVFDSLYLGGGTPSMLEEPELTQLMTLLPRHFPFHQDLEITIEVNPDDVTSKKLALFRHLGINRISVGVQSFSERALRYLKRRHTAHQTQRALEMIRAAGFTNMGLDLMYGFEGQSEADWLQTLSRALEFAPEHLSCYQFTLEEGTPFGTLNARGLIQLPDEEQERSFFLLTSRFLEEHGYLHYEISNFSKGPIHRSRHNQKYWRHTPYLGLGPAAHSFLNGARWWNVRSVERYCQTLLAAGLPVEDIEQLSVDQLRLERLYLGFRTCDGVDLDTIRERPETERVLSDLTSSGLLKVEGRRAVPTRSGFLVADHLPLYFPD